jgi:hypothetical protein
MSKRADILVLLEKNSMTGCVDMVLTNQLLLDILATIILFLTLQSPLPCLVMTILRTII